MKKILGMLVAAGLLTLSIIGPAMGVANTIQEDSPRWDCGKHGNRVCGDKPAALASAKAQSDADIECTLTAQDGPTPPWGWRVDCRDVTAYHTPVPVSVTPRYAG